MDFAKNPIQTKPLYGGYIGVGYDALCSKLGQHFSNPFTIPLSVDFVFKNFVVQLNMDGGYSQVSKTMLFADSTSWKRGENAFHSTLGLNLGYGIYNNKKICITPIIGYASSLISKKMWSKSDIAHNEPHINYTNIALLLDFKDIFVNVKVTNSYGKYSNYVGVRIIMGAYIPMDKVINEPNYFDGSKIYLSVGIVNLSFW